MQAAMQSWVQYDSNHQFSLENIPFGCFHSSSGKIHCCTRIGDTIVDLAVLFPKFDGPLFSQLKENIFDHDNCNKMAALGSGHRIEARQTIQKLFAAGNEAAVPKEALSDANTAKLAMPVFIRDYTDFYSSKNHAYNVGVMFRGPDNALQPNWTHLPVGYHGRASSIVIDGTPITRPCGQTSADGKTPEWTKCMRLDFELEMGTVIGMGNELGHPIKTEDAQNHIFGYCLLNDWSARDIQKWEYVPLGPFTAKNFASTISPWIVTPEALAPFRTALPKQEPAMLPYLEDKNLSAYDINLTVSIKSETMDAHKTVSESNMKHLYYSVGQTIAHHSASGCNMSTGDLLGSGTISSTEESGYGSMLELCWAGKKDIDLGNGETRKFLKDGDEVNMMGTCKGDGYTIGFGDCRGKILPAHSDYL